MLSIDDQAGRTVRLARLREEEGWLSSRQRRIIDRIDLIRSGCVDLGDADDRLRHLLEEERVLSDRRQLIHQEIDALRSRLHRRGSATQPQGH